MQKSALKSYWSLALYVELLPSIESSPTESSTTPSTLVSGNERIYFLISKRHVSISGYTPVLFSVWFGKSRTNTL